MPSMSQSQINAYTAMTKVPQGLAEIAKQLKITNRLRAIELNMEMCKIDNCMVQTEDFAFVSSLRIGNGML